MKSKYFLLSILFAFILVGCETLTENSFSGYDRFPEIFIEAGNDLDYSYRSLRTTRLNDGSLKVEVTEWGIEEYGLFIDPKIENGTLMMNIIGICGTVMSKTWVKVTFDYTITKTLEETLQRIQFVTRFDTLIVVKKK